MNLFTDERFLKQPPPLVLLPSRKAATANPVEASPDRLQPEGAPSSSPAHRPALASLSPTPAWGRPPGTLLRRKFTYITTPACAQDTRQRLPDKRVEVLSLTKPTLRDSLNVLIHNGYLPQKKRDHRQAKERLGTICDLITGRRAADRSV